MRPRIPAMILALATLLVSESAEAGIVCDWFGRCVYESPGFQIRVVDRETGQPLAGIHALAVWLNYGLHGTRGPLMALEAVSGPDGRLGFSSWGPLRGSQTGLVLGRDPAISLFTPGYRTLLIYNPGPPDKSDTTRERPFWQDGQTLALEPFKGTREEWVEQLRQAAFHPDIGSASQYHSDRIRAVYLNRMLRVKVELEKLPQDQRGIDQLLWSLDESVKLLGGKKP